MVALLHLGSASTASKAPDAAAVGTPDEMTDRILDAALAELIDFGLRRFSVEHVARRAAINRITIYRRFASKDVLLQAVLIREGQRLFATVDAAIAGLEAPADQIVEGFAAVLLGARRSPLVQRMLAVDPETLGSLLLTHGGVLVAVAREYLAAHAARLPKRALPPGVDPAVLAELAVRLCLSFLITPEGLIPLDDEDQARAFARQYLIAALGPTGGAAPSSRTSRTAGSTRRGGHDVRR